MQPTENPHDVSPRAIAKTALIFFLPVFVLTVGIAAAIYLVGTRARTAMLMEEERLIVDLQAEKVAGELRSVTADLKFLSYGNQIDDFFRDMSKEGRKTLEELFLRFSSSTGIYDQIRLLDENGMEIVRINFNGGSPSVVPDSKLQNKKNRYYFADAFRLDRNEVFVSPLDLNVEGGQIEQPLKPMIRLGTPVFDPGGRKRGIVLLNYLAGQLLQRFDEAGGAKLGQSMLLNADGYWCKCPNPNNEWGFMYEDRKNRTFARAYPEAWQQILWEGCGQFEMNARLFTFATVYPLRETQQADVGSDKAAGEGTDAKSYVWKAVSFVPEDVLYATSRSQFRWTVGILAVLAVVFGFGSWRLAWGRELKRQSEQLAHVNQQQAEAIDALSTPLIPLHDEVVVMPLVGALDNRRMARVRTALVEGLYNSKAKVAILDITGVPPLNPQAASELLRSVRAAQLLGAQVIVTGIQPETAEGLIDLGIHLDGLITERSLQSGIARAMDHLQTARGESGSDRTEE